MAGAPWVVLMIIATAASSAGLKAGRCSRIGEYSARPAPVPHGQWVEVKGGEGGSHSLPLSSTGLKQRMRCFGRTDRWCSPHGTVGVVYCTVTRQVLGDKGSPWVSKGRPEERGNRWQARGEP